MNENLKKIFGYLLGLIYLGIGIFGYYNFDFTTPYREGFLILFIVYGIWRLYRAYKLI
jgi:hypothetical protein